MNHKDLDLVKLSTLTSHQIDHVTCLECCKYYIAPTTATCGHTLCHTCWRGRRTCPVCAATLDRKTLKLNLKLQTLTQHVQTLGETFEKLFNIKLNEYILDTPDELELEKDPNKNVTEWLASSQNQFSSPLMHSQQSIRGLQPVSNPLEISARNIQIHSEVKKTVSSTKVISVPPPQDDWDKIEPMPDLNDGNKNKENIVGPMDIEPFFVDDTEYTLDRPRRSSRKRESKNDDCNLKTHDPPTSKNSSRDSSGDNEKKSEKSKQTWSNVKKMRKEFSKLNKKNKNKLNVSIEMVKKTQHLKTTNATAAITPPILNIDDNTPDNANKDIGINKTIHEDIDNEDIKSCKGVPNSSDNNKTVNKPQDHLTVEYSKNLLIANDAPNDKNNEEDLSHNQQEITTSMQTTEHHKVYPAHSNITKIQDSKIGEATHIKMPFIKKSALLPKHEDIFIKTNNNVINCEQTSANTDDIEITIKIGNTITNIVIKKKESDVQVKVNTDREVQTSLGNYVLNDDQKSNETKKSDTEINLNNNPSKTTELVHNIPNKCANVLTGSNLEKSTSTKKNTASAETVTATTQFEITESVEKELSNIMECEETAGKENLVKEASFSGGKPTLIHAPQNKHRDIVESEMDDLNDLDIFGSGSVKETNVQMLKEPAPSEIFVSTVHSKYKTQKIAAKRDRDNNDDALPKIKKMKITQTQNIIENIEPDSEPINYDAVMGQVFANIDADIEVIRKSQCQENTNTSTGNKIQHFGQPKYIISQTQTQINEHHSNVTNIEHASQFNQKHSEMVFSMIEKDDENSEGIKNERIPQGVEELLTPGLSRNLNVSQENQEAIDKTCKSRRKSLQDNYDSDKSIEETPQKNVIIPKLKRASTSHRELEQSQALIETKKIPSSSVTENKSVINLTDTLAESNKSCRDITDIDSAANKITLETPLTISKFADQIKHKSTPVARKSLNFDNKTHDDDDDPEQTLCPSSAIAKTTQEKEFLRKAFEKTPTSMVKSLSTRSIGLKPNKKLCIAGSCLPVQDTTRIKYLCKERNWTYVEKYTKDLTHLVVGVDEENKSQRSVKYMCALAASKWIVSFEWIEKCLLSNEFVNEEHFEALDSTGEPGPRRSRIAKNKLFQGIKFYCMPPFSVLDVETLKSMLVAAGGRVVNDIKDVRVATNSDEPALLLAEPEHTQEDRFIYLTMELGVVPVNYEWVLNCLGSYNLGSIHELLLCPSSLLPPGTAAWPDVLLAQEYD